MAPTDLDVQEDYEESTVCTIGDEHYRHDVFYLSNTAVRVSYSFENYVLRTFLQS